KAS
ncbi:unnamed protein product, partial [Leptidea sinapis]